MNNNQLRNMFSSELLKQKTNQQLRLLCKDRGLPQYGDKATLITRIMGQDNLEDDPSDIGGGDDDPLTEDVQLDYRKMKKNELVQIMKDRKLGGFSGKKKDEIIKKLLRHDEESARLANEKRALGEDFGECEQCEDLPNIKHVMKAKFSCNDCQLKICGPCEIAHIKTKATRHHLIEPLHQLNLMQHPIPVFAKPSTGGQVSTPDDANEQASQLGLRTCKKKEMKARLRLTILIHLSC